VEDLLAVGFNAQSFYCEHGAPHYFVFLM
jgi:hypothetical protein